jgi:hypothetical protein
MNDLLPSILLIIVMVMIRLLDLGTADLRLANQGHGHLAPLICLPLSRIVVQEMKF